jgi:P27 family predicted phage terminase small subunit
MGEHGPIAQTPKPKTPPVVSHAAFAVPTRPDDLTPATERAWDAFWRSPMAGLTAEVDIQPIVRLFGLYAQHEKAAEVVSQALMVKGSTGQIRVNPLADHMLKLEGAILRLENELGLTPMARARLGIEIRSARDDKHQGSIIDELAAKRHQTA